MTDITDIKTILYIEKSLNLQEQGAAMIQTSPKMTRTGLRTVLKECLGAMPQSINSLKINGKAKRFRGCLGQKSDYKKFYVKLPEGVSLESAEA